MTPLQLRIELMRKSSVASMPPEQSLNNWPLSSIVRLLSLSGEGKNSDLGDRLRRKEAQKPSSPGADPDMSRPAPAAQSPPRTFWTSHGETLESWKREQELSNRQRLRASAVRHRRAARHWMTCASFTPLSCPDHGLN